MKAVLKPGAELELLTQGEVEDAITAALSGFSRPPQTVRTFEGFTLDSSGNSHVAGAVGPETVPIYTVEQGMSFTLHRLLITAQGYTPASPYTASTFYVNIMRASRIVDFYSLQLPAIVTYGSDAPLFNNAEHVGLYIVGGPASGVIVCDIQGTLETLAPGLVVE